MPYRFNGVECDTVEELRALTGYPMNQVFAETKPINNRVCKGCGLDTCAAPYCGSSSRRTEG